MSELAAWLVLLGAGGLEAVWAAALAASRGFRRPGPAILFVLALGASMGGLALALTALPVGTAYAVWVGTGAVLALAWSFATRQERPTAARVLLLILLVASVAGLRAVS